MKRWLVGMSGLVLFLSWVNPSFALFASHPKIDEQHVKKDLIGKTVQGWTFREGEPCRTKILDAKYDKETAIVYISLIAIDKSGRTGRQGKLRLEYEYAADDWNMIDMKQISFSKLEERAAGRLKHLIAYPLLLAAYEGDVTTVKSLIDQGADVNQKDNSGMTALIWAASEGRLDVTKVLLAKGADVNVMHKQSYVTPLMAAAFSGHAELVQLLLTKGSKINAKNVDGITALMLAIEGLSSSKSLGANKGIVATVKILLDNGADVSQKDNRGETALMWANEKGLTDIVQLLEKAGAKE